MKMYSAAETDPLLPSNTQAPEINTSTHHYHHHDHHSVEIDDGTWQSPSPIGYVSPSPGVAVHGSKPAYHHSTRYSDVDEDEEERSRTFEHGATRFLKAIFTTIFVVVFFATMLSMLQPKADRSWPLPGQPSHPHPTPQPERTISERARDILSSMPLIDGHNDFAIFTRTEYKNNIQNPTFKQDFEKGTMALNVDLPRLRAGQAGGAFWSAFVACPPNASYDMTDSNYATAVSHTLEQIDVLRRLQAQYPLTFTSAEVGSSGRQQMFARWNSTKALFGPLSIEGLHQVPPTAPMAALRSYYSLGIRMATLTWNCHNPFADAALVWNDFSAPPIPVNGVFRPKEGAVTARGKHVLQEMNRLGMIIDISHTSYWTQKAILSSDKEGHVISRAPAVFSHSSAYSLCPHPRNVKDDILDLVPQTNSLVMVNFSPDFISCLPDSKDSSQAGDSHFSLPTFYEKNNTLHQVARHITYIGQRIGYSYVGIGSDFDGMGKLTPQGLEGVDKFPDLVEELLKLNVSDEDAKKVVGGNLLRLWKAVDDVSDKMKEEGVEPGLDNADGY